MVNKLKKKNVFVVQSNSRARERVEVFWDMGGGRRSGRWESGRMCAISDPVLSSQLCPHCSVSASNDLTAASCHMTMSLLTCR